MAQHTIVALYRSLAAAESAKRQLEEIGIPSTDIALREGRPASVTTEADAGRTEHGQSFMEWLFGAEPPQSDLEQYRSHLAQEGGAALSIRADGRDDDRIAAALEATDVVGIEGTEETRGTLDTATATPPASDAASGASEETVLPTAREELAVGKRQATDTRNYRIRRYVVEQPAEASVALHDERVVVERRAGASTAPGAEPFEESEVEVTETREEPVVEKRVVAGEEVVVRKEARDRVEKVRDTVRESRVEVDRAAAGNKPGGGDPAAS
jgi:uncharacterized protein (TIGR02271 family)